MSDAIGLIVERSRFAVGETIDRLAVAAEAAGNTIFARVDHERNALDAGLALRPTQVLIFGQPMGGTPLMAMVPSVAIDLPVHVLAWRGDDGITRIAWNDPYYLAARHGVSAHDSRLQAMSRALRALAATVA